MSSPVADDTSSLLVARAASLTLQSGLKRLKRDVTEAALCLASLHLPAFDNTGSTNSTQHQLRDTVKGLRKAAQAAGGVIAEHAAAADLVQKNIHASDPRQDTNELCLELQKDSFSSLCAALDQLQQAAKAGLRSAIAALKPLVEECSQEQPPHGEILEAYRDVLNMADSIIQALDLLRQHADCVTPPPASLEAARQTAETHPAAASHQTRNASIPQQQPQQKQKQSTPQTAAGPSSSQAAPAARASNPDNMITIASVDGVFPKPDASDHLLRTAPGHPFVLPEVTRPPPDTVDPRVTTLPMDLDALPPVIPQQPVEQPEGESTAAAARNTSAGDTGIAHNPPAAAAVAATAVSAQQTHNHEDEAAGKLGVKRAVCDSAVPMPKRHKRAQEPMMDRTAAPELAHTSRAADAADNNLLPEDLHTNRTAAAAAIIGEAMPAEGPALQSPAAAAAAATTNSGASIRVVSALNHLVQQLSDPKTVKQAARNLAKKVMQSTAHRSAVRSMPQAIKGIMLLLESPNKLEDRCQAAEALAKLATKSPEGQTAVAAAGGIQKLVQIMGSCSSTSKTARLQVEAADALWYLVKEHEGNARAVADDADCIAALCYMLEHRAVIRDIRWAHVSYPDPAANAGASIIGCIAEYCLATAAQELIKALVNVIEDEHLDKVSETAATAIFSLCTPRNAQAAHNRVLLAAAHGIEALVKLLQNATLGSGSRKSQIRIAAALALGAAVYESAANREAAAAAGCITLLVSMTFGSNSSISVEVQSAAMQALHDMMWDCNDNRSAVAAAAGEAVVPRLVQLLSSSDAELQCRAASALQALVDGDYVAAAATRECMMEAGVVQSAIAMLSCRQPDAWTADHPAQAAARLLCSLSYHSDTTLRTGEAVQPLLEQITVNHSDTVENISSSNHSSSGASDHALLASCTGALVNLMIDDVNKMRFIALDGVPIIVNLLTSCKDMDILNKATCIMSNLARPETAAANVEAAASAVGEHSQQEGNEHHDMLSAYQRRQLIAASGAIEPLVALLNVDSRSVQQMTLAGHAASALWYIAHDHPSNKEAVVKAGAIPLLVKLLGYRTLLGENLEASASITDEAAKVVIDDLLYYAAGALLYLADNQPHVQAEIAALGGIRELVAVLQCGHSNKSSGDSGSDGDGLEAWAAAAGALAAVAVTQSEAVAAAGAVPSLVRLLHAENVDDVDSLHEDVAAALAAICKGQPKHQAAVAAESGAVARLLHLQQTSSSENVRKAMTAVLRELKNHPTAGCDIPDGTY